MNRIQKGGAALLALAAATVGGFEGVRYHAYPDPASHGAPYTVCDGHTGPDVHPWTVHSPAECKAILLKDLSKEAGVIEACIPSLKTAPDARYVAVLDLAHNIGPYGVCRSSVARDLNAGRVDRACDDLMKYRFAAGREMPGLVRRREAERAMCLGESK